MSSDISRQEKAIKALKELGEVISLWASGKITHSSAMESVQDIVRKAK